MATTNLMDLMDTISQLPPGLSEASYSIVNNYRRDVSSLPTEQQFPSMVGNYQAGQAASWAENRDQYVKQYKGSVYIAIGAIARLAAMQTVKVKRRIVKGNEISYESVSPTHPLIELLERVNPQDTAWDLWFYMVGWRFLTGDSFIYKAKNGFGVPQQLWPMPSQYVHVIPSPINYIEGYQIKGSGVTAAFVPSDMMIHIKNPSFDWAGTGRYYGMPAIKACAPSIELENEMWKRLYYTFKNFAPPGMVFETEQRLQPHQSRQIWGQLAAQHAVAEASGKPLLVHSGLKLAGEFSRGQRELDYTSSLDTVMDWDLATIGVPRALAGMVSGMETGDIETAIWACAKTSVDPMLVQFSQHLTQDLAKDFEDDLIITLGPCQVDTLDSLRLNIDLLLKAGAATPDEVRHMLCEMSPLPDEQGKRPIMISGFQQSGNDGTSSDKAKKPASSSGKKTLVGRAALASAPSGSLADRKARRVARREE